MRSKTALLDGQTMDGCSRSPPKTEPLCLQPGILDLPTLHTSQIYTSFQISSHSSTALTTSFAAEACHSHLGKSRGTPESGRALPPAARISTLVDSADIRQDPGSSGCRRVFDTLSLFCCRTMAGPQVRLLQRHWRNPATDPRCIAE